ncbi:glutaredoxin 2 isoform X2 [Bos mutus]|uniref:glutaredoxin 2 isoform X2 n=1 Tax=Bos mutus TaxID=72004 RepID=UPI0006D8FB41|nr:PREDICTED: glutaredoxin 2 isoform X2 [Bos mutus]
MYWRRAALVGTRLIPVRSSSAGRLEGPAGISGSGMGNSTSSSLGNAATAPVNQIQETISNNCVVIFSKTSCSYCRMAKNLFHDMNVNYKVVELDMLEYGSQFQDALHKMTGERTGIFPTQELSLSPVSADGFFTTELTREAPSKGLES